MTITDAAIANPDWDACETCGHYGKSGCNLLHIDLSVYLGDWIICDDYFPANRSLSADGKKHVG